MKKYFKNKAVLLNCKIYQMLFRHGKEKHISFHMPGHKNSDWDITELSFSDNLACPSGCIAEAEQDIAKILGAKKSFILTDGSTCGVFSMLYATKLLGAKSIAVCEKSHKSVFNACQVLGLTPLIYPTYEKYGIPYFPRMQELLEKHTGIFQSADALFFTSPDYYGNIIDLTGVRNYCQSAKKLLLIDGAHGGHLHFDKTRHASAYADMWVDGVHKSLPAFTQGAVVSAGTQEAADALFRAVDIFRTTSPSYPIMASVEYAVKYPQNTELEECVRVFCEKNPRVYPNQDWTKLCAEFGTYAFEVSKRLEAENIYCEFCDGNVVMFYLSPATTRKDFEILTKKLRALFALYPLSEKTERSEKHAYVPHDFATKWVELESAEGQICGQVCGLFPPCVPLISVGERITKEKIQLLQKADNVFGLKDGKISVFIEDKKE